MLFERFSVFLWGNSSRPWTGLLFPIGILFLVLLSIRYALAVRQFNLTLKLTNTAKNPPMVPYLIPFIGEVPGGLMWDPRRFIITTKRLFWNKHPVKTRVMGHEVFIIQGSTNIQPLLRQRSVSPFIAHAAFLHNVFCLPPIAADLYHKDDSGEYSVPSSGSTVDPKNRVNYLTRNAFNRLLSGPGLVPLNRRFERNITKRLLDANSTQEWENRDDLMDLFQTHVTAAIVDSMGGPFLLENHPSFTKDLWVVDHSLTKLMLLPRLFTPRASASRDNGLAAIMSWNSWARANFDPSSIDADGDDPYWGTEFFREMNEIFSGMDGFDENATASEIFAFLWGTNTNAVTSTFWASMEVFKDPELLELIRCEAQSCIISHTRSNVKFDIDRLLQQPTLQAVFCETLRLRINGTLLRYPSKSDLKINNWIIPQNQFTITSMTPGHMDPDVWCSGSSESHPPEEFWPGRFLVYSEENKSFQFSMSQAKNHWMPFGGGQFPCPGRHLAKLTAVLTMALLTTSYDSEISASESDWEMSSRNFGFGALGPVGKIPGRFRRREAEV